MEQAKTRNDTVEDASTLAEALAARLNAEQLKMLARLTPAPAPTRKGDIVAHVLSYLAGDRLRRVWEALDDLQKAAVAEVVHSTGTTLDLEQFRAKYGEVPNFGTFDRESRAGPTALRFFLVGGYAGSAVMPVDLKRRLATFVPSPAPASAQTVDRPPETCEIGEERVPVVVRENERAACRDVVAVLRLVDAGAISVGDATRRPSASSVAAVAAVLDGGDLYPHVKPKDEWYDENAGPIRAFAWPLLVQAGGLAERVGARLRLTKAGRRALGDPVGATLRSLWDRWVGTTMFDELSRIDCVKGQTGKGKRGLTAASSRREAIARALAGLPPGRWISADEFLRFARARGEDYAVSSDPWGLYVAEAQYGSLGYDGNIAVLDDRYVRCVLLEYAATLGLVDVALVPPAGARSDYGSIWGTDDLPYFSRYDGLTHLRVTPLGAHCLGSGGDCPSEPLAAEPALRVLPNLEIAAVGEGVGPGDRLALDAYAVRVSDHVWRLEADRCLEAAQGGRSLGEIREFLSARNDGPLPSTVVRFLDDVERRCRRIRDRGLARLVECEDADLATLVAHDTRTRDHCMRAGERHLVVPASSETAFRRGLREIGYLLADEGERVGRTPPR